MKVKDRRDDKLFKMSVANYIMQFITTFFLYLSLRITVLLPRRNASVLCNNMSWRRDEDLRNHLVPFTVMTQMILNFNAISDFLLLRCVGRVMYTRLPRKANILPHRPVLLV